ncbi:MAG TPA: hypothetical protein VIQ27_02465 [Gemmatimonadales bacterium]
MAAPPCSRASPSAGGDSNSGYGLSSYSVEIQGTNNFAGINRTGKIKYTVNGWRFGGVYAF